MQLTGFTDVVPVVREQSVRAVLVVIPKVVLSIGNELMVVE